MRVGIACARPRSTTPTIPSRCERPLALRVNLDDPIALLVMLALAMLGLAGAWLAGRWSGGSKRLDGITLIIRVIILVELILLAATTIFSLRLGQWRRAVI